MLKQMEGQIRLSLPSFGLESMGALATRNYTVIVSDVVAVPDDGEVSSVADPEYEQFLADVWVGIILTLMVLSCVCCMCSCLLYHKFQQWKQSVMEARRTTATVEAGVNDSESLPSYTLVSGLPSYAEALEQLRQVSKQVRAVHEASAANAEAEMKEEMWVPRTPPTPAPMARLSVVDLFQLYKAPSPPALPDTKT